MNAPLRLGIAGLGTVGASVVAAARDGMATRFAAQLGRSHVASSAVSARKRERPNAASASTRIDWHDDPVGLARSNSIDVFVELIGGERRRPARCQRPCGAEDRQGRGHRQQGAARPAWRGARQARGGARRAAFLRGGGRRRHPDHQDAARGARRQPADAHLRNPERHLQFHPDPDGGGRDLRRCAEGSAGSSAMRRPIRASTSRASTRRKSSPS